VRLSAPDIEICAPKISASSGRRLLSIVAGMKLWASLREWAARYPATTLGIMTVAVLLPQVAKPFNMDDPLFIWAAQHIRAHPADPYGFEVNWYGTEWRMADVTKNPPLACYYLAVVGSIAGWSEYVLHGAMLLPAIAVVLGTSRLARNLRSGPFLSGALALFSPVFLISSTTVMCDVLMLAFWVWAVVLWVEGIQCKSLWRYLAVGALISLAQLTKYYGAVLVPLLAAYAWLKTRRVSLWSLGLGLPVLVLVAYDLVTSSLYGRSLLGDAVGYAAEARGIIASSKVGGVLVALDFMGGCLAISGFLALRALRKRAAVVVTVGIAVFACVVFATGLLLKDYAPIEGSSRLLIQVQVVFWAIIGASVIMLTLEDLKEHRDAEAWLLTLWVMGTFVFAAFCNWTVNGRSILPLVPAAAILAARRVAPSGEGAKEPGDVQSAARQSGPVFALCLACGIAIALLAMRADFALATAVRESARLAYDKYGRGNPRFRFQGHWGFQYYMEQMGAQALDEKSMDLKRGDIVAAAVNNVNYSPIRPEFSMIQDMMGAPEPFPRFVATMKGEAGAGFYAANRGPLPFAFGIVPDEKVGIIVLQPPPAGAVSPTQ
jgi:hypothetical protein